MAANTDGVSIDCPVEEQQTLSWCWLTLTRSVNGLINPKGRQYTEGELADIALNRTDCTLIPTPASCVVPGTNEMIAALLWHLGIDGNFARDTLSFQTCIEEHNAGRIFWIEDAWKLEPGGHVKLSTGYRLVNPQLTRAISIETVQFEIRDPWFGRGQVLWQTYDEMLETRAMKWVSTFGQFKLRSI